MTSHTPTRVCFELQIKPELLDEYIARHTPVWPEMLAEIAAAGRRNYSLFLAEGGRLVAVCSKRGSAVGSAVLAARFGGHISHRDLFDAGTPDLPGFELEEAFTF